MNMYQICRSIIDRSVDLIRLKSCQINGPESELGQNLALSFPIPGSPQNDSLYP